MSITTLRQKVFAIAILFALVLASALMYRKERTMVKTREEALAHNLHIMREAIDSYTLDNENPPQSLDDLVQAGYLLEVPMDPITQKKDWQPIYGQSVLSADQTNVGLEDVQSNSDRYSKW